MNKAELAAEIAARTQNTKKNVEEILGALTDVVIEAVAKGDRVTLVGFGTFERRERQARETNNPQKPGQKIKVPAKKVPAFSAGIPRRAPRCRELEIISVEACGRAASVEYGATLNAL
mgnify:CR=1 FL=1